MCLAIIGFIIGTWANGTLLQGILGVHDTVCDVSEVKAIRDVDTAPWEMDKYDISMTIGAPFYPDIRYVTFTAFSHVNRTIMEAATGYFNAGHHACTVRPGLRLISQLKYVKEPPTIHIVWVCLASGVGLSVLIGNGVLMFDQMHRFMTGN